MRTKEEEEGQPRTKLKLSLDPKSKTSKPHLSRPLKSDQSLPGGTLIYGPKKLEQKIDTAHKINQFCLCYAPSVCNSWAGEHTPNRSPFRKVWPFHRDEHERKNIYILCKFVSLERESCLPCHPETFPNRYLPTTNDGEGFSPSHFAVFVTMSRKISLFHLHGYIVLVKFFFTHFRTTLLNSSPPAVKVVVAVGWFKSKSRTVLHRG